MRKGARVGAVSAGTPRRGGSSIGGTFTLVHAVALAAGVTGLTALGLASKLASGPHAPLRGGLGVGGGATVIRGWEAAGGSANNPAWRGVAAAGGLGGAAGAPPPPTPSPDWRYRFSVVAPPSPSPLPIIYNLRGCTCASNAGGCSCGGVACPAYVTAKYLTDAVGQDACSLRRPTGFTCTAKCQPDDKPVLWFAGGCGGAGQGPCDPLVVPASATASPTGPPLPSIVVPRTSWVPDEVYDFRGGGCELLNGKEQCYMEDGQVRRRRRRRRARRCRSRSARSSAPPPCSRAAPPPLLPASSRAGPRAVPRVRHAGPDGQGAARVPAVRAQPVRGLLLHNHLPAGQPDGALGRAQH